MNEDNQLKSMIFVIEHLLDNSAKYFDVDEKQRNFEQTVRMMTAYIKQYENDIVELQKENVMLRTAYKKETEHYERATTRHYADIKKVCDLAVFKQQYDMMSEIELGGKLFQSIMKRIQLIINDIVYENDKRTQLIKIKKRLSKIVELCENGSLVLSDNSDPSHVN